MLVCINGTGSRGWDDRPLIDSHVHRFYQHRSTQLKKHFHGPSMLATEIMTIVDQAWSYMRGHGHSTRFELVGFSRGGAIAIELAHRLNDVGRKVNFLGLFDAVDRSFHLTRTETIPGNVEHCAHALRDPNRHSRDIGLDFKHTGLSHAKGVKYRQDVFFTTHGGVGGTLGRARGDFAGNAYGYFLRVANAGSGFDSDVMGSRAAWSWMVLEARKAGIRDIQLLKSAADA